MIHALFAYLRKATAQAVVGWDRFWFSPSFTLDTGIARIAIAVIAVVHAAIWLLDLHQWIDGNGRLNVSVTRFLIGDQVSGTGSVGRVSLLYGVESSAWIRGYLITTILCCAAMALGLGGRAVVAIAWILTLGIVHRVPSLLGAGELLFTGVMGYLVVDPGKTTRWTRIGLDDREVRWTSNLTIRLIQCHFVGWLAISLASHIAEPMWWTGTGVWWLASGDRSPWLSAEYLSDKPYFMNALSHGFIAIHLAALALFFRSGYRAVAIMATLLMSIGIWIIAGDWMYSLALVACTSCFWGTAIREVRRSTVEVQSSTASLLTNVEKPTQKSTGRQRIKR